MKVAELAVILEIAGDPAGKDGQKLDQALADLQRSKISGCPVALVFAGKARIKSETVPCFGHSNLTCSSGCKKPQPWGVKRYFGVRVFVLGKTSTIQFGRYRLNSDTQLDVCARGYTYITGERELVRLA